MSYAKKKYLTVEQVLEFLEERSKSTKDTFWKLEYYGDRYEHESVFFKGNIYAVVKKAHIHLKQTFIESDMFGSFSYGDHSLKYKCKCGQPDGECYCYPEYTSSTEAIEDLIKHYQRNDTLWLRKVEKPVIL